MTFKLITEDIIMNGAGLTVIVSLPFYVAVGVGLRDSEDSVDAVRAGPLVRRVVRRQDVLLHCV